jgi:hypothetical protein
MPVDMMRLLPSQGTVRSPGTNVAGVDIVGISVGLGDTVESDVVGFEVTGLWLGDTVASDVVGLEVTGLWLGDTVGSDAVGFGVAGESLGDLVLSKTQNALALSQLPGLHFFTSEHRIPSFLPPTHNAHCSVPSVVHCFAELFEQKPTTASFRFSSFVELGV